MRVIVAGLGVQGEKRRRVAGDDLVATVDPAGRDSDYKSVRDVPLPRFDAALVCTPDECKLEILEYLLGNGKHVLVEKPLLADDSTALVNLARLARANEAVCYTAYNHRFEPHFVRMRSLIESGELGDIYSLRMFYGNGTARLVRNSEWRDKGAGVLPDLGSHLLDTVLYWLELERSDFEIVDAKRFENRAFDHVVLVSRERPTVHLEMTLLSWRNHFYADVLAEKGSAHIRSLCKWGPSEFIFRQRELPSGRPNEKTTTLIQLDPTWEAEYRYFKALVESADRAKYGNTENDIWINDVLSALSRIGEGKHGP